MTQVRLSSSVPQVVLPAEALWLGERGLCVGNIDVVPHHVLDHRSHERLEALLAIAFRRLLPAGLLRHVVEAINTSSRGDQALANLRLAIAGLSRVPDAENMSQRMSLAKRLLDVGLTSGELLRELDLGPEAIGKTFDPSQPRVPAGSGDESGRWTSGSSTGAPRSGADLPASLGPALAVRAAPLLAPELGAGTLAALSALAATVGFAATLGALFVPSPNNVSTSGPLPDGSSATYSYDHDEGLLRVLDSAGTVLAAGHKDTSGIFFDADTGVPFARELDGALLFDGASFPVAREDARVVPGTDTDDNEPKLCPDPGPDQPGSEGASPRAKAYQEQISRMINPQRPLQFGLAMNLVNPSNGKIVHYDECDEQTGAMIEAKGPGFNGLLSFPSGEASVEEDFIKQGNRELAAAETRQVIWYFAEDQAADCARELFAENGLGRTSSGFNRRFGHDV